MENPDLQRIPDASKRHPWLLGCGALLVLILLILGAVATTLWWVQRPIPPVVLSSEEKVVVEKKIHELEKGSMPIQTSATISSADSANSAVHAEITDPVYIPGTKVLRLTEREINGLLNQNTELGDKVRFEFVKNAVNAYLAIPIPEDFPIGAGTVFRMRGRFRVSIGNEGEPYAILEDVTIFGLSLPKAWLGGIKGENLLGEVLGGGPRIEGIKRLEVEPGALVLEVED